jgi:hypothetical protein
MFSLPTSWNRSLRIRVCIFGGLLLLASIAGFFRSTSPGKETALTSATQVKTNELMQPVKADNTPQSAKGVASEPPVDAWATPDSRDILGGFFIKPYLRQWLKDPDSLQDFQVVGARPDKKLKGSYKVTVFYRARNSFGALIPERRTVTMVYNPKDENHPWVMFVP